MRAAVQGLPGRKPSKLTLDSRTFVIPRDFKDVPIVVTCRDRLAPLLELLDWLERAGYSHLLLIDNASTYPPLVDFLATTDAEVVRLQQNVGHLAPWGPEVRARLDPNSPFVVTDCDVVPDENCPPDVVDYLAGLLLRYANVDKVGLGLRIDDLPDHYALKAQVIAWESQFWELEIGPGVFQAEVDTTFALYRSPAEKHSTARALRTGTPYVARHLGWYADSTQPTDEQRYYREHADPSMSHWEADEPDESLRRLLKARSDEVANREIGACATANRDPETYYEWSRPELRALVPAGANLVLDVGCGHGALGAALKSERPELRVHGIEYVAEVAAIAGERLDEVIAADLDALESLPADWAPFDAVICGDVLEHLRDPARVLNVLRESLAPAGVLIASIPNIKHWSVVYPLLVQDLFTYEESGLLDRTHVHFFTLQEIDAMFTASRFAVQSLAAVTQPMPPTLLPLLEAAVALGAERAETEARLSAYQYVLVARAA